MAVISKNIFVVSCEKSKFETIFSRKRNSDIINYHEIRQRLTNNDVFKTPPSKEVVEFQIIKKLNSFSKCRKTEFLFFYMDNITSEFLSYLKSLFSECEFPVNYHLLLENDTKIPKIHKEFNSVQLLEKEDF
jgi:hypothetical protein